MSGPAHHLTSSEPSLLRMCVFIYFFSVCTCAHKSGKGRENPALGILTWAKIKTRRLNRLSHPGAPEPLLFNEAFLDSFTCATVRSVLCQARCQLLRRTFVAKPAVCLHGTDSPEEGIFNQIVQHRKKDPGGCNGYQREAMPAICSGAQTRLPQGHGTGLHVSRGRESRGDTGMH